MNILAVIPARGGSKRILKKNLRLLSGKPLLYYSINTVLNSKKITDIVVSSEDETILEYSSSFGVDVRKRPSNLALDNVPLDPVIYDAVVFMEKKKKIKYDIIITIQPTSPLLKSTTLDKALNFFVKSEYDTLLSVVDSTHLYWKKDKKGFKLLNEGRLNSQWLQPIFRETGSFLFSLRKNIKPSSRIGKKVGFYLLDHIEGLDLDTPEDWIIAEAFMNKVKFLFVVNGNERIGMGHVYRTLNLASHLLGNDIIFLTYDSNQQSINLIKEHGYEVIIVDKKELLETIIKQKPDIIINDILDTSRNYVKLLVSKGFFVVNFEDLGEGAELAHLVFNALYEKANPPQNHKFGYKYVCLNPFFYLYKPITFKRKVKHLFVTFGGVDQNNLSKLILSLAPDIFSKTTLEDITIVVGPSYPYFKDLLSLRDSFEKFKDRIHIYKDVKNMPSLMSKMDLAITSNGRTIYELAVLGVPTISISQNDRETLHLFARYSKGIKYLGIACNITKEKILNEIITLIKNNSLRKKMYQSQIEVSSQIKKGVENILFEIKIQYLRWKNEKYKDR